MLAAAVAATVATLPPLREAPHVEHGATLLLSADGAPLARRGAVAAEPVRVEELPAYVPAAFVAIEDRRFYAHAGVDPKGLARALTANLANGGRPQGASTITQQLVKNAMLGPERTLRRKWREAIAAIWIERRMSKADILSRYLSTAYFGEGSTGLGAASQTYFAKSPADLTLAEAATLAGMMRAPSRLAPTRHPAEALSRRDLVLDSMAGQGLISREDAEEARRQPLVLASSPGPEGAGFFADWAASRLPAQANGQVTPVRTSLDPTLQAAAEAAVEEALSTSARTSGGPGQAALVAMRPDGEVVAMVGGRRYTPGAFNRATQARRQPGSTFKLFVYLAAFRAGARPDSIVADTPLRIGNWTPSNADGRSQGLLSLETAFAQSSNLAAVRVSQAVGLPAVVQAARDLGLSGPLPQVPSLALGSAGVSLLELTSAYASVAAGAYPVRPVAAAGASGLGQATVMDAETERAPLLDLLAAAGQRSIGGTFQAPVFAKTGTTQNYRDALFVGFVGDLVVGVWVGNDDETPMDRVAGASLPAQIWRDFMRSALPPDPPSPPAWLPEAPYVAPGLDAYGWSRSGRWRGA